MVFKSGDEWNGNSKGRPIGAKNKLMSQRDAFLQVFNEAGGNDRLVKECKADADRFFEVARWLVGFMPKKMEISHDGGILAVHLQVPRPEGEVMGDPVTVEGEIVREQIASNELSTGTQAQHTELSTGNDELSTGYPQAEVSAQKEGS